MTITKQPRKDFWSKAISIALVFATMSMFLPQLYHFGVAMKPDVKEAVNGQVVIGTNDFSRRNLIALGGDWHFYWQQLLTNDEIQETTSQATTITATGGWQVIEEGHTFSAKGFATYHLSVVLDGVKESLALRIPHIETAYRLYVNDNLVASAGVVSATENQSEPGYKSSIILLPQGVQEFSLTLQISNYHSIWGGIWSPIIMGEVDSVYELNRDKFAFSMFILGALLITAIHFFIHSYLVPTNRAALIFACLCIILLLREMTNEHMYAGLSSLGVGFTALIKLSYLTFYVGFPLALYFVHNSFRSVFSRKTTGIFYIISILFSIFVLLSPVEYIGHSLLAFQLIALAMIIYAISRIYVATANKQVGAKAMLVGISIIFLFILNDMLYVTGVIMTGRFMSLGIVGFIICQSYAGNKRMGSLIFSNRNLTNELKNRNKDLETMSELLETKVERRTQQLKVANKKLEYLANLDKLTGTLNRHGLQQHLIASFERFRRTSQVFSIVLIDYDNFKVINDTFGHDVGDTVLKTGANIINECIREQDKLARWGGEEFLILLPETGLEGAKLIADKLRIAIQKKRFENCPTALQVTVTGGVGVVQKDESFEMVFKRVDTALYKGKHAGKNCIYS